MTKNEKGKSEYQLDFHAKITLKLLNLIRFQLKKRARDINRVKKPSKS